MAAYSSSNTFLALRAHTIVLTDLGPTTFLALRPPPAVLAPAGLFNVYSLLIEIDSRSNACPVRIMMRLSNPNRTVSHIGVDYLSGRNSFEVDHRFWLTSIFLLPRHHKQTPILPISLSLSELRGNKANPKCCDTNACATVGQDKIDRMHAYLFTNEVIIIMCDSYSIIIGQYLSGILSWSCFPTRSLVNRI